MTRPVTHGRLILAAVMLAAATGGSAAGATDPVVPFPVATYPCDVRPPGWPATTGDPWCGTWDAGATTPRVAGDGPMAPLGRITFRRVGAEDAKNLMFYDAVGPPEWPPLTDFTAITFTRAGQWCAELLLLGSGTTRFYLGAYANGDERGYVGGCSDTQVLPTVFSGGYVSQTSADPGIDRWQRVRRRGRFSLDLWPGSTTRANGEMDSLYPLTVGLVWWDFQATRVPEGPAVPAGSVAGQPAIYGRPVYRVLRVVGTGSRMHAASDRADHALKPGWFLGRDDVVGVRDASNEIPGTGRVVLQHLAADGSVVGETSLIQFGNGTEMLIGEDTSSLRRGVAELEGDDPLATPAAAVAPGGASALSHARTARAMARTVAAGGAARARVVYDPRTGVARVADRAGTVRITPTATTLAPVVLTTGQEVQVGPSWITRPAPLASDDSLVDLAAVIPAPRVIRGGPTTLTAPSRLSLRALHRSKCVRVAVRSTRPARVLVTIYSGRRSMRLFGQRLVRFTAPRLVTTCIRVPAHARTFNVRTPLNMALGWGLGPRPRPGQRPNAPVVRPIRLVP